MKEFETIKHENLIKEFKTWDEIFEYQARKDGANYHLLKEWLIKYYEIPKTKNKNIV